ncbi:MAG: N-acetylmuramoyl-L-alanine amidase [Bacteroidetes bacterium]|nr:N-acetylmuramoyl-L-alanine amidase [Bacteroidota bacterium]
MKKISKILCFIIIFQCNFAIAQQVKQGELKLKTVVLDAGHGGHDPGAVHGIYKEKDVVLKVVLKLGKLIEKNYSDIKVVYTRKTDVFIPLYKRGAIANKAKGDLFISVHVNSAKSKYATGVETYTLGLHKSAASLAVAKKENAVITLEENYKEEYGGFSPDDPESYIMFSMGQQGFLRESIELSYLIQQQYKKKLSFSDRGIKQAGYLVLWRVSMPAVLTELPFISNATDRKFITSNAGQDKIANSLFGAFCEYKKNAEHSFEYCSIEEKPKVSVKKIEYYKNGVPKKPCFSVQIMSSRRKVSINKRNFGDFTTQIMEVKVKNRYKYFVGVLDDYQEILDLRNKLRKNKFKDAYEVGFLKGNLVKASELKKIIN